MNSAEPTKVLAIDDDPDICFYIQEILECNNCVVTLAERGRDALRLLSSESFDIVMADVRLPDLDGVSILEQVRLTGSDIPFVFITGFSEHEPIIASMRLGAVDYLTKPFTPSDLAKALRRALAQKKRTEWSRQLYKISGHQNYTLHEKIQKILRLTVDLLEIDFGLVVRHSSQGQKLCFSSEQSLKEQELIKGVFEKYLGHQRPQTLPGPDPVFYKEDALTWVAIPLQINQKVHGTICFFSLAAGQSLTHDSSRSVLQLTELSISRLLEAEDNTVTIANQQSLIMAAQNLSSLGELATSIVHEIENHLTVIAGRTVMVEKLLRTDADSSSSRIKLALGSISTDVKRIDRIVKSVRTIAHNGQSSHAHQLLQLNTLLDEVLDLFRCKIKSRAIQLSAPPIPAHFFIKGDPTQLLQVFLILLNNSFDAIEAQPEEWIHLEAKTVENSLQLSVTDSGSGIPEHLHERIFEPFFTTKEAGKGLGVGLSLARKYVESHGGKLWIDRQSSNTCFVVQLFQVLDERGQPLTL